ncbi:MAG: HIT family protein, partial [Algisphaera sp.]
NCYLLIAVYELPPMPTLFSKIIAGEIPCHRLYEDDHVLAFLDIGPVSHGHCLVIPKEPAAELGDLSDDAAAALGRVLPRLVRAVKQATGCEGLNVLQNNGSAAGQEVMHVHFHLIPRYGKQAEATQKSFATTWPAGKLSPADAADLIQKITAAVI